MFSGFIETSYRVVLLWFALALLPSPAGQPGLGNGFWHTRGSQLLDSANRPVRIAGVNWYGFETTSATPGGLQVQDYKTIIQTIRRNGYNAIRLPFSNQMVESSAIPTSIAFNNRGGSINTDLKGLTSLEVLDRIVAYAGSQGLKIILDNHRSEAGDGTGLSGLWFTQAFPESAWIADWQMLARRYAADPTVIGMDLRNEPHNANASGACWGCGSANDWRFAAERAGNAILGVNPHLLIFVEGVDAFENDFYWWGGNLEGVRSAPVRLHVANQLVYSAHDYGPVESGQPWFTPNMSDASLKAVWTKHWAYIMQQNIAPVWLGEFGTVVAATDTPTVAEAMEARWFQSLTRFLASDPRLNWSYWALNGEDRYGLLNKDYDDIKDSTRQQTLTAIQSPAGISLKTGPASVVEPVALVHPPVKAQVMPVEQQVSAPAEDLQCQVEYSIIKDWQLGFTADIIIRNTGRAPIVGWKLTWTYDGTQKIAQLWNGRYTQEGGSITVSNETYNAVIPAGSQQTGIGFNAIYSGENHAPAKFYLNGSLCK